MFLDFVRHDWTAGALALDFVRYDWALGPPLGRDDWLERVSCAWFFPLRYRELAPAGVDAPKYPERMENRMENSQIPPHYTAVVVPRRRCYAGRHGARW